ncbi:MULTISPECIES: DUF4136 domain-containing protein [unclassified Lentimonas]|uniref:DUF4136 domain-containing protein n=1 Tax=unclassified Lentimonas TaxID=2630993 RepID=UPI001325581E|nr:MULTISPECIES: DUF4136 domain-containing protein [unclassified Lentimonas]CAA6679669.1 Unannotated [Lentimonas sp. CC4]CAA6683564.1 Unannotated [Lentimonas sp. CC6]CAA6690721.1 Unannotated [Lentimonas sp. CC19]CAA6693337.1 Unannotated [Lentimonas sp. CC10]CAA7071816.1 Unannotated [Lentimonas sp. CC11]
MKPAIALLLLLSLAIFSGCTTTPFQVKSNPESVDKIKGYQCFKIDSREARAKYQDVSLSPIVDSRIATELRDALKMRGFTDDCEKPDFLVTYATKKTTVTRMTDMGMPVTPGKYPYTSFAGEQAIDVEQFKQGTFILYIIDEPTKEVVWWAIYQERERWEPATDKQVRKILVDILAKLPTGS